MNKRCLFGFLFVILIISSCEEQQLGRSQLAKDQLIEKLENYDQKMRNRCLDKIRKQAEQDVDSFLLSTAKQRKIKNIEKPILNERPEKPEVEFPEFTDPVE